MVSQAKLAGRKATARLHPGTATRPHSRPLRCCWRHSLLSLSCASWALQFCMRTVAQHLFAVGCLLLSSSRVPQSCSCFMRHDSVLVLLTVACAGAISCACELLHERCGSTTDLNHDFKRLATAHQGASSSHAKPAT